MNVVRLGRPEPFGARRLGQEAPSCERRVDGGAVCSDGTYHAPGCPGTPEALAQADSGKLQRFPAWSIAVGVAGLALTGYLIMRKA